MRVRGVTGGLVQEVPFQARLNLMILTVSWQLRMLNQRMKGYMFVQ